MKHNSHSTGNKTNAKKDFAKQKELFSNRSMLQTDSLVQLFEDESLRNERLRVSKRLILQLRLDVLKYFEDFSLKCSQNVLKHNC